MNLGRIAALLREGDTVTFIAHGHSMAPRINDGDTVTVEPVTGDEISKGEIVLARVNASWYLHLVTATDKHRVQISNNHGHVNGWTARRNVVGRKT